MLKKALHPECALLVAKGKKSGVSWAVCVICAELLPTGSVYVNLAQLSMVVTGEITARNSSKTSGISCK